MFHEASFAPSDWEQCACHSECFPMGKTTTVLCSSDIDGRYVSVNLLDQSLLHTDPNNFLLTICELEVYEGK